MHLTPYLLTELAQQHGDAFYLLDTERFASNYSEMLAVFRAEYPDTHIAYSYKTNYTPALCRKIDDMGGFAEVVSEMEYELAQHLGVPAAAIYFNGPYKKEFFLRKALLAGANVNLDSLVEVEHAVRLACENPERQIDVGLRCNFDIGTGRISRFGLDIDGGEFKQALSMLEGVGNIVLAGLHCHFPNRQIETFTARAAGMKKLLEYTAFTRLQYISFGGGYFGKVPSRFAAEMGLSVPGYAEYATVVGGVMRELFGTQGGPSLIIEPGSALVADTMCLAARVISLKAVRGRNIATLSASSYNVNPSVKGIRRPLDIYRCNEDSAASKRWDLVGYTCIEDDCMYAGYEGALAVGDFAVFSNVGSYSVVFKPPFILPNVPVLDIGGGMRTLVKRAETFDDIFTTFVS